MSADHVGPRQLARRLGWFVSTPTKLLRFDSIASAVAAMTLYEECSLIRECECGCGEPAGKARQHKRAP